MTDAELGWAAGLFEGEGSLFTTNVGTYPQARATLVTTDLDVVERFQRILGVGRITPQKSYQPHHKQRYRWSVDSKADFRYVMELFEPFLGERRFKKRQEVLTIMDRWDQEVFQRACARKR